MLDLNKPIRRKGDQKVAKVIASGVTQEIPGVKCDTMRRDEDTLLVEVDGKLGYYQASGQFAWSPSYRDLENYSEPVLTSVVRSYTGRSPYGDGMKRDERNGRRVKFDFADGELVAVSLVD